MHPIRTLLLAAFLLLPTIPLSAQTPDYQVPSGINLSTAAECRKNKAEFIKATDYLLQAPIDAANIKEVNSFAMLWLTNTDEVSLSIEAGVIEVVGKSGLLIHYLVGWARYVLRTGDTSEFAGNLAGTRTVLSYYKDPAHKVPADKNLDRLVKLEAKGKLETELADMFKKAEAKGTK